MAHLPRSDRLALALWWLIESVADEFQMPPEQAADEVAMLCGLAKEMMAATVRDTSTEAFHCSILTEILSLTSFRDCCLKSRIYRV